MLVLERKLGQRIVLCDESSGEQTSIEIVGAASKVKLGISAPEHVRILRQELIGSPRGQVLGPLSRERRRKCA